MRHPKTIFSINRKFRKISIFEKLKPYQNKVIDRDDKLIHTIAEGFNGLVQWSPQWNASLYKCQVRDPPNRFKKSESWNRTIDPKNGAPSDQALIRAKNEEMFSSIGKNRKKDMQRF